METKRTFLYCLYGLIFILASNCIFPVYCQQPRPGMLKPEEELPDENAVQAEGVAEEEITAAENDTQNEQ